MIPRCDCPAGWVSDVLPNPDAVLKLFLVRYRIRPAREKQRAFADAVEAHRFRSAMLMRLEAMPSGNSAKTFDEAADAFLDQCKEGAGNWGTNERILRIYIRPLLVGLRLDQIDEAMAIRVRQHVLSFRRILHYQHAILASFDLSIDAAVAKQWLIARPFPRASRQLPREAKSVAAWTRRRKKQMPSRATVKLLLDRTEGLLKVVVALALRAGLRVGEILALTWKNVKIDKKRIEIAHSADSDEGPLKPTKTPAGVRSVEMGANLAKVLSDWREQCISQGADGDAGRVVFRAGARGCFGRHRINKLLQAFLAENGVGTRYWHTNDRGVREARYRNTYSIHDLRHACVALWIWRGYEPWVIQTMIGHEQLRTTFDIYGYLIRRHEDGARDWTATAELAAPASPKDKHGTSIVTTGYRTMRVYGSSVKVSSRKGRRWWGVPAVQGEKVGRKPKQKKEMAQ